MLAHFYKYVFTFYETIGRTIKLFLTISGNNSARQVQKLSCYIKYDKAIRNVHRLPHLTIKVNSFYDFNTKACGLVINQLHIN